jgi:small subunit ribosomal protein S6
LLREYEVTIIAKADLPDGERAKVLEGYEAIMKKDGGEILKKDDWGTKKMAYPINKQFRGHYVFYTLAGAPEHLTEAQRLFRFDDNILRYLVVKAADQVDIATRKEQLAKERVAVEE